MTVTPSPTSRAPRLDLEGPLGEPILFDQYSRYASCAEHLVAAMEPGETVLDVGCGPCRLLGSFLRDAQVTYLDPLLDEDQGEHVLAGRLERLAESERRWDWVVAVDTLEHVEPGEREAFLGTLLSLARRGVILTGPYAEDAAAVEVDARVNEIYAHKTGEDYPWLEEHIGFGLPTLASVRERLERDGMVCAVGANGHAPWLDELLPLFVVLLDRPQHRELLDALSARFNRELYEHDHLEPVYRRVLVGRRGAAPELPAAHARGPEAEQRAAELWREFQARATALLGSHADELAQRVDRSDARLESLRRELRRELRRADAVQELLRRHEASLSWRLTRPLRLASRAARGAGRRARGVVRGPVQGLARKVYHALPLGRATRHRARLAFLTTFGWLLRDPAAQGHAAEERRLRREREAGRAPRGAGVELRPSREGLADVIVWGVIDWHFRIQRPQHLARELARAGHRVFYVSPLIERADAPSFAVQHLDPELPLYHVQLSTPRAPVIYSGLVTESEGEVLEDLTRDVLRWIAPEEVWTLVEHPGWGTLPELAPNARLVYDWMDNHQGFAGTDPELVHAERGLLERADLVIVTSEMLRREAEGVARAVEVVRNAGEFEHFHAAADAGASGERQVIGYYGALAEWFDTDLVRHVARRFPTAEVRLVGADTAGVAEALAGEHNVRATGEVPYASLPGQLAEMDVCLIPFQLNELTRATNPVKVYEYLAAGKPVVTTHLPEIRDGGLDDLVARCKSRDEFLRAVEAGLDEVAGDPRREARIERARQETWEHRAASLRGAVGRIADPLVSVVVITWNNLALTQACLASLFADPSGPELEVVVVDNGSRDGTPDWLREQAAREPRLRLVLNEDNRGFAAANNQGLEIARGEYLVMLNNDTVVTRGWLRTMVGHFRREPGLGLLGPLTNNIGNEAKVEMRYTEVAAMPSEAARLVLRGAGRRFDIPVVAFFCVMLRRETFEEVGPLDEGYGMGFFEDDDYCCRVRKTGRTIRCAEDVFVHHELSASFGKVDDAARTELFERNKRYYESKWGEWVPHEYRT